jgi:fructokinase
MSKIFCIGETLIDFIPVQKEKSLKEVVGFERVAGGAPMNVAIAAAKYGCEAVMLTKMANDHFGDHIMDVLQKANVDTSYVVRSDEGETGLAFVSVDGFGERTFNFYRQNAADLLFSEEEIDGEWFSGEDFLHFCSVDLVDSPMKIAHKKAIKEMKEKGGIISFDPNVRLPLWPDAQSCRKAILEFLPLSHIVKISDEELSFITGIEDEEAGIKALFTGDVKVVVYTKGRHGASIHFENGETYEGKGFKVTVADTTGAGDAFIGGFLSELSQHGITSENLVEQVRAHHEELLTFANASGALTASVKGAIQSAPGKEHVLRFIETRKTEV